MTIHRIGVPTGFSAVIQAVRQMERGEIRTAEFALARHPRDPHDDGIHRLVSFGLGEVDGEPRWRWCGEDGGPDGPGSHTIICDAEDDPAELPCAIACALTAMKRPGDWIFRQR